MLPEMMLQLPASGGDDNMIAIAVLGLACKLIASSPFCADKIPSAGSRRAMLVQHAAESCQFSDVAVQAASLAAGAGIAVN